MSVGEGLRTDAFFEIGGVRELRDGSIVVADGATRELRYFNKSGRFVRKAGRHGRGPGEFEGPPALVPTGWSDSLIVFDPDLARIQLFSIDGRSHRTVNLPSWRGSQPPVGAVDLVVLSDERVLPHSESPGVLEMSRSYVWVDLQGGQRTAVDSFGVADMFLSQRGPGRPALLSMLPFAPCPTATVTSRGVAISRGFAPEIREYDLQGKLRRIVRIDEPQQQVTDADIEAAAAAGEFPIDPQMPIPDVMPAFQSLQIDQQGWLWAEVYRWDDSLPATWLVFDTNRRARGSVQTPARFQVAQIGDDFLLGVSIDTLGVEKVRRYGLKRSGS